MSYRQTQCGSVVLLLLCALAAVFCTVPLTQAQDTPGENGNDSPPAQPSVDPALALSLASPQATMRTFLEAMDEGRAKDAIVSLDIPQHAESRGVSYATKLKQIIDRMVWVSYEHLSDDPEDPDPFVLSDYAYDLSDPQDREDARKIRIVRGADGLWKFSKETVAAVDEIYDRWEERPLAEGVEATEAELTFDMRLRQLFPQSFRQTHFLMADYLWVCLLGIIFLGFVADFLTRGILRLATTWWFKYVLGDAAADQQKRLWRPVGLLAQALVWYFGVMWMGLPELALAALRVGLIIFAVVSAVWTAFLLINLLATYLAQRAARTSSRFDDLLIPMVSRTLKVFVVCVGVITGAQALGWPIMGLLGGLGIGGIALALASQDAVSNLFGSVTVLVDRPFEIGDWVIIDGGVEGSVETVGFRSTRIRTFYNSLITVPNSKLTTAVVDNMGRRRYRRIKTMLGVQYDTTPEQVEAFCEGIREIIRRHPYTRKDYYHVYLNAFSGSSLDILLYCFVECPDWSIELREKQRLYLDIMRLAKRLGIEFAFPTRTLHMFQEQHHPASGTDLSAPETMGRRLGAEVTGPVLPEERRPGHVEFHGPLDLDDDAAE